MTAVADSSAENPVKLVAVVLCGGGGTRLWPKSRGSVTKPFVQLPFGDTLLSRTYARLAGLGPLQGAVTVASQEHAALCGGIWKESPVGAGVRHCIIGEPLGRNTAPAIAVAAETVAALYTPDAVMAVLPADHLVKVEKDWAAAVLAGASVASERLALVGIAPTRAETGYGYVCIGEQIDGVVYRVDRFVEKPAREQAEKYLASGRHLWNAGIFIGRAGSFLREIGTHKPEMAGIAKRIAKTRTADTDLFAPPRDLYEQFESVSFDVAVAERAADMAVAAAQNVGWSDVGSWRSFAGDMLPADECGNRMLGNALARNSSGCIFWGGAERFVLMHGLEDVCVIDDGNATLICRTEDGDAVGGLVGELAREGAPEDPPLVPKPWGSYRVISEGKGYRVKRIDINPGARLSLQSHSHRSEHWTTVLGTPTVTIGSEKFEMPVDRSCHIPAGMRHRIANTGTAPAAIIEVQIGSYLGEDDIVRHEDDYRRS